MTAETKTIPTPWAAYSEGVPLHLDYPDCAMVDLVENPPPRHRTCWPIPSTPPRLTTRLFWKRSGSAQNL